MPGKGFAAETADMVAEVDAAELEDRQLALLPVVAPVVAEEQRSGPGRPKGSRNRAREQWRALVLHRFGSPLLGLASLANMPVGDLWLTIHRERLRVSALVDPGKWGADTELPAGEISAPSMDQLVELLRLQMNAHKELLPYLHERMPQALGVEPGGELHLHMHGANDGDDDGDDVLTIQGVSGADPSQSDT